MGNIFRGILTNNWEMTLQEVLDFYNQRGAIERNFDMLKNDFNWRRLPFSFLNENTVFMIISAIISVLFQYLIRNFSKKSRWLKRNSRLKNFIFFFITVGSEWVSDSTLKLFTPHREILLE